MRFIPRFVLFPAAALLFACVWTVSVCAAEKSSSYYAALESIRADELAENVGELADPEMEGRESGARGGHAAGEYLAEQYAKLRLRGAGDDGKFFQHFEPNFRNVLAFMEGSDPKLRDEVIVVGAHYDHIGYGGRGLSIGPYGYVYPGADDNASGTSAVLQLAKAFTILARPPKRSILFANWDAEEKGLLGSKHWVAHPTVPLERVTAALNMDMIGQLRDNRMLIYGSRSGYGWRRLLAGQNEDVGIQLDFVWDLKPNADHWPFFVQQIPVLMFHTGKHDNYHRTTDLPKFINNQGMMDITRVMFGVVYELAERPEALAFRAAARHETLETEKDILEDVVEPVDRLGVGWIEDAAVSGGVLVSSIVPDSPADKAGLQVGDCIIKVAGREIQSDDDFFGAVSAAVNPTVFTVKRAGGKKSLKLTATLAGNPMRWGITWRIDDAEPGVVILTHLVRGSPAARAGLTVGDRIYQVGGRDFADETAFSRLTKADAESLQLLVERDGRLRVMTIQFRHVESMKRAA